MRPPLPVLPGAMIADKYRVTGVIGEGGMGVVLAAEHTALGRRVAIKFLHPDESAAVVERFAREARIAVQLESEHVCKVYDVGRLPTGEPYMVMEYLQGQDLAQLVAARGALPAGEAVDHVLQACEGLAQAHVLGIVHRDLKPANMFLTRRVDGSPCLKVLDFGISKASPGTQPLTMAGAVLGSPRFISPEQLSGAEHVDARSDIWALGVVLHELLTGQAAFAADTIGELCFVILNDDPPPLDSLRPEVPRGVVAAVARCLRKHPAERFDHVAELALALQPFGTGAASTSAQRAVAIYTARGWVPPPSTSTVSLPPGVPPAAASPGAMARPRGSSRARLLVGGLAAVALGAAAGVWALVGASPAAETAASDAPAADDRRAADGAVPDDPLRASYDRARSKLEDHDLDEARERVDGLLDALADAGVAPGHPRSRFAAHAAMLKGDILRARIGPPPDHLRQSPWQLPPAITEPANEARRAYANVGLWKHADLAQCAHVRGAEAQVQAADIVEALPIPKDTNPAQTLEARLRQDYALAAEGALNVARIDFELALKAETTSRACATAAERGLTRVKERLAAYAAR